jgi:hypothetical protein
MPRYRTLDPDRIIDTLARLERRIAERFPGSGLSQVCRELNEIAGESKARVKAATEPNVPLRAGIGAVLLVGLALLAYVGGIIEVKRDAENLFGVLEGIDAGVNILVLMGAGAFFLATIESRLHRKRALDDLHELRSIVHVIDMHQLTKDPSKEVAIGSATQSSPSRVLTPFELSRYLDYCSEMLSLAAKIAALYAQGTRDPVVIETSSDIGQLTSNLSAKIWQKITILHGQIASPPPVPPRSQPGQQQAPEPRTAASE